MQSHNMLEQPARPSSAQSDYGSEVQELSHLVPSKTRYEYVPQAVVPQQQLESLAWHDIDISVTDRKSHQRKDILVNVSGQVRPGQIMALMGPSGSGKTTLLNTLAQRHNGAVRGQVFINGKTQPLSVHRAITAYVEQDDTLIGSLTTRETLQYAADLTIASGSSKADVKQRICHLLREFGLMKQADTLIGTPFRKGLSGGQKRRLSVAASLITDPRVLYLDEPTSGLDSTASFEIINFIRNYARQHQLIVIASIHQPSTKTFNLFDQVTLLSQGRVCYCGAREDVPRYFAALDLAVPPLMNPAEHVLDLLNVDFANDKVNQARLDEIVSQWERSNLRNDLIASIRNSIDGGHSGAPSLNQTPKRSHSTFVKQVATLLHRSFVKSYRDIVVYWIRLVMYMGLAFMMGTVWLRLKTDEAHIQAFINAIFFGSAFMSFMAVAYVPAFLEDRSVFVKERANGLYGSAAFLLSNFLIGVPYLFLISFLFSIVAYWLSNFNPTGHSFGMWVMWLFLDLLAAESLVILITSIFPNFVGALAIIAFTNGLWMSVGGFLVSLPNLNVFWKYVFHYWDYQAYVFQGMMVNEFKYRLYDCTWIDKVQGCRCMYPSSLPEDQCQTPGTAVLSQYGYDLDKEGQWVGVMLVIILGYRLAGWAVTYLRRS